MTGYVYIITNKYKGTPYIGVTSDLVKRIYEHKNKLIPGFSSKYNLSRLVYYEVLESMEAAITREKQLKNWHRQWKINLVETSNPNWDDLYNSILGSDPETSSG